MPVRFFSLSLLLLLSFPTLISCRCKGWVRRGSRTLRIVRNLRIVDPRASRRQNGLLVAHETEEELVILWETVVASHIESCPLRSSMGPQLALGWKIPRPGMDLGSTELGLRGVPHLPGALVGLGV